jgi:transketolase
MEGIFEKDYKFELGKGVTIREGRDISIIATGIMTTKAIKAAEILSREGIEARIINIHTIKPIDEDRIINAAKETGGIITCENHSIIGGLGSAVAEIISQEYPVHLKRIGIKDVFGESGSNVDLFRKYGMTEDIIVQAATDILHIASNIAGKKTEGVLNNHGIT